MAISDTDVTAGDGELSGWFRVPGGEECDLWEADLTKVSFPKRVWTSCGVGCAQSVAALDGFQDVSSMSTAAYEAGDLLMSSISVSVPLAARVRQAWWVSDGRTVAAVARRTFGTCADMPAPPSMQVYAGQRSATKGDRHGLHGRVDLKSVGPVRWQKSWLPMIDVGMEFTWDGGFGLSFRNGNIGVITSVDATDWTYIATGQSSYSVVGRKTLISWTNWGTTGLIRGYTTAGGIEPYVTQPMYTHTHALSDDRMVWIGLEGPSVLEGIYDKATLYWSSLPSKPGDVTIMTGPDLPATADLTWLKTGGDYAATMGCLKLGDGGFDCMVLIAQLSAKRVWRIRNRPENTFTGVLAVSPSEILLGETNNKNKSFSMQYDKFVRLKTAELDAIEKAW